MAGPIVDFVVGKLKEQAFQEIIFQWRIKAEVDKITVRLGNMKGIIKVKQDTREAERWVNQLREAIFELEDLVEELMLDIELLDLNTPPCNFCQLNSLIAAVPSFAKRVKIQFCFHQHLKAIDERLLVLEEEKSKYKIQLKTTNEGSNNKLLGSGSGYMEELEAVGIDKEVNQIAELIEKPRDRMMVITVWGAGGSGKTTLAKQVYERVKNDGSIDCFSWVDVNQSSDIDYVLRKTIDGLYTSVGTKPPQLETNILHQHICDYLKGKRYVLFLDDVWDHDLLSQINLPANRPSLIIVTSRDENIARGSFLGAVHHHVDVKPLDFGLACSLFCKMAFPNNFDANWPNDTVKRLGEALVKRCGGLPVAIVAMGGMMCGKEDDLAKWRDAQESLDSELEGSLKSLNRAVLLSYNELPTHLKSCFLYCAMFPKTHYISAEELIRLCIAEGFINEEERGGRTLEDIARDYFIQLKNRSLLQILPHYTGEDFGRIQMHDLYREVACQVIRRDMFAEILEPNTELESKQRRLIILKEEPTPTVKLDNHQDMKLRTLIIYKPIALTSFPHMLKNVKLLRVLVLEWMPYGIEELPNELGDLIHLRYINLKGGTKIRHLPDSLGRLHNLQTLDMRYAWQLKSLPECVPELKQLRHLFGNKLQVPDIVFTFSHLQTLSGIKISTTQATELVNIRQLTELNTRFMGEECWRAICVSVKGMTNLRSLTIVSDDTSTSWEFGNFSPPLSLETLHLNNLGNLTSFATTLNYLHSITIKRSGVDVDFFNSLEKLPSLSYLFIHSYTGKKLLCNPGSFPGLKKLHIECTKITEWEIGMGAMKRLQSISMKRCQGLEMLPEGLRELEDLKQLEMWEASKRLVQRATSVGGPDRWKVEHIPRVTIQRESKKPFFDLLK